MKLLESTSLSVDRVSCPLADWAFILLLVQIGEASCLNARLEGIDGINVLASFGAETREHWTPLGKDWVCW